MGYWGSLGKGPRASGTGWLEGYRDFASRVWGLRFRAQGTLFSRVVLVG